MKNYHSKILAIIFLVISIIIYNELNTPIKNSTVSFSQIVILKEGKEIKFRTDFSYPYRINFILDDSLNHSLYGEIVFKINEITHKKVISLSYKTSTSVADFKARNGDEFILKIIKIDQSFKNKKVFIDIDVNGGGPSVGLVWEKEIRPYLFYVLYCTISIVLILIVRIIYQAYRKKNYR